jgi:hypothetical protein
LPQFVITIHLTKPLFVVAPTLTKTSPKVVSVKDGTLASLSCEGQGRPQPEVTWFKDGTDHMVLAAPPEVYQGNLSHDGGTSDVGGRGLSLARVSSVIRPTEPGLYTCLMKNLAGHVTFNVSLYVEGKQRDFSVTTVRDVTQTCVI